MERNPLIIANYTDKFVRSSIWLHLNKLWRFLHLLLSLMFFVLGGADIVFAESTLYGLNGVQGRTSFNGATKKIKLNPVIKDYLPYLQIDGARLFNVKRSKGVLGADLFAPIWQERSNLIFTDIRIHDASGKSFGGNIQLGYRHLVLDERILYGIYASFDRRRTDLGNYFSQLVLGGECWFDRWFIGGNVYKPIGATSKDVVNSAIDNNSWLITQKMREEAMVGADVEVGCDFTASITGYVGGYYYNGQDVAAKYGPKARVVYDWSLDEGRILGVVDKVSFELGMQRDKPQGTAGYLSASIRLSWLSSDKPVLKGVARHMVDSVRRNMDIVTMTRDVTEIMPNFLGRGNSSAGEFGNKKLRRLDDDGNTSASGQAGDLSAVAAEKLLDVKDSYEKVQGMVKEKPISKEEVAPKLATDKLQADNLISPEGDSTTSIAISGAVKLATAKLYVRSVVDNIIVKAPEKLLPNSAKNEPPEIMCGKKIGNTKVARDTVSKKYGV